LTKIVVGLPQIAHVDEILKPRKIRM
jgi:hypothetical protein